MSIETQIRKIADLYGAKVRFFNIREHGPSGYFRYDDQVLLIGRSKDKAEMLSTFFHELGHYYCWENGIWPSYHRWRFRKDLPIFNARELRYIVRTGLRTERWVDNWGKATMKLYYPELRYRTTYRSKESVKWYNENFLDYYRWRLNEKKIIKRRD